MSENSLSENVEVTVETSKSLSDSSSVSSLSETSDMNSPVIVSTREEEQAQT